MIGQHTDKIVDLHAVQVTEVSSSNAMEREGFKCCMNHIKNHVGGGGGKLKLLPLIAMLVSGQT